MSQSNKMRTPLKNAKGLGASKEGVGHWWAQRVTAVALIPLVLWFAFAMASLWGASYDQAEAWIKLPFNAIAMLLFVVTMLYHSQLGLQIVIEDYVHREGAKIALLLFTKFLNIVLAVSAVYAVLKVAL